MKAIIWKPKLPSRFKDVRRGSRCSLPEDFNATLVISVEVKKCRGEEGRGLFG